MAYRALLICPDFMGLYQDIKNGFESIGINVDYIAQKSFPNNPYNLLYKNSTQKEKSDFDNFLKQYWEEILANKTNDDLYYDYVLVIDGLTFHPYLLDRLKTINPNLKSVNYLYDRIKGVYQIDHNFKYFDKVFSFDLSDVREYNLNHLPIYWVYEENKDCCPVDIFAFGTYDKIRIDVFKRISALVKSESFSYYIKLYYPTVKNKFVYILKRWYKALLRKPDKSLPLKDLKSDLFTDKTISTEKFRIMINSAKVIVDTNHPYQDGLTARFMWALGAGKKIITNNLHADQYSFYSKEQILILNDSVSDQDIVKFIKEDFILSQDKRKIIDQYRIDNWLNTLFNFE